MEYASINGTLKYEDGFADVQELKRKLKQNNIDFEQIAVLIFNNNTYGIYVNCKNDKNKIAYIMFKNFVYDFNRGITIEYRDVKINDEMRFGGAHNSMCRGWADSVRSAWKEPRSKEPLSDKPWLKPYRAEEEFWYFVNKEKNGDTSLKALLLNIFGAYGLGIINFNDPRIEIREGLSIDFRKSKELSILNEGFDYWEPVM